MELPDSTPIAGDGEALRARLAGSGVLLLRRWLDAGVLRELRLAMLSELDRCGWLEPGSDPTDARPGTQARVEGRPEWWDGYHAIQRLEAFHAAAHQARIVSMLGELFGEAPLVHPRKIARIIYPQHPDATTPPHQDFPYIRGTADFFTLWVPLTATPASLGGLQVLPGSHRAGMRTLHVHAGLTGAPAAWVDLSPNESEWVTIDYELGDAILFHSLVVHAGLPNLSDRLRLSLDFRYQPLSEPIAEANLYPHLPPYSGDLSRILPWDDLTDGWSTRDWIATLAGTTVVDGGGPEVVSPLAMLGGDAGPGVGRSRFVDSSAFAAQCEDHMVLVDAVNAGQ